VHFRPANARGIFQVSDFAGGQAAKEGKPEWHSSMPSTLPSRCLATDSVGIRNFAGAGQLVSYRQGGAPHGAAHERFDLYHRFDRRDPLHSLPLRPALAPGRQEEVVP
jgi:hypothetical protein